jgi:hypothetical protein
MEFIYGPDVWFNNERDIRILAGYPDHESSLTARALPPRNPDPNTSRIWDEEGQVVPMNLK